MQGKQSVASASAGQETVAKSNGSTAFLCSLWEQVTIAAAHQQSWSVDVAQVMGHQNCWLGADETVHKVRPAKVISLPPTYFSAEARQHHVNDLHWRGGVGPGSTPLASTRQLFHCIRRSCHSSTALVSSLGSHHAYIMNHS